MILFGTAAVFALTAYIGFKKDVGIFQLISIALLSLLASVTVI